MSETNRRVKIMMWIGAAVGAFILLGAGLTAFSILKNGLPLFDPPGFGARVSTYLTANVAETSEDGRFPELRPRRYDIPPDEARRLAIEAFGDLGWRFEGLPPEDNQPLEAVAVTPWMGFEDDVSVMIELDGTERTDARDTERTDARENGGSVVNLRSSSRVGRGDLGTNARHILDFFQSFEARQAAAADPPAPPG